VSIIQVKPYNPSESVASQRFLTAGSRILPERLIQSSDDIGELRAIALRLKPEFERVVNSYAQRIGCQVIIADIKSEDSAAGKAVRKGSPESITDFLRASLLLSSPNQISEATRLLSPLTNSDVVAFENSFARPNIKTGMRRTQSILRISDGVDSMLVEIQGRHTKFEDDLKVTHSIYESQRNLQTALKVPDIIVNLATAKKIRARIERMDLKRLSIHHAAALAHGLERLEEQRVFFAVERNGEIIPAFAAYRRFDGLMNIVRPDAQSGCYIVDNNLTPYVRVVGERKGHELRFELRDCIDTRNDRIRFIQASEAIAAGKPPHVVAGVYGRYSADVIPLRGNNFG
jgi:hypothetical protein